MFSTNILGNRDGEVLGIPARSRPRKNEARVALEFILQPHPLIPSCTKKSTTGAHNYYPTAAATIKEGWDNIDIFRVARLIRCRSRWTPLPRVDSRCADCLDLVTVLDLEQRAGMRASRSGSFLLQNRQNDRPGTLPGERPLCQLMK